MFKKKFPNFIILMIFLKILFKGVGLGTKWRKVCWGEIGFNLLI